MCGVYRDIKGIKENLDGGYNWIIKLSIVSNTEKGYSLNYDFLSYFYTDHSDLYGFSYKYYLVFVVTLRMFNFFNICTLRDLVNISMLSFDNSNNANFKTSLYIYT